MISNDNKEIEIYGEQLKRCGALIIQLVEDDDEVRRLMHREAPLPFERELRKFVTQFCGE